MYKGNPAGDHSIFIYILLRLKLDRSYYVDSDKKLSILHYLSIIKLLSFNSKYLQISCTSKSFGVDEQANFNVFYNFNQGRISKRIWNMPRAEFLKYFLFQNCHF